ncbi:MAG: hypothetical protein V7677_19775, partial [Motiliproteus sp.]
MGGMGSGNGYRWNTKTTLEQTRRIDIRFMKKQGLLVADRGGSLSWSCNGEPDGNINYRCYENSLELNFKSRSPGEEWESVKQTILFDRTPCNYGGERLWFRCPHCDRRVGILSGHGSLFLCRHCYQLPYGSQNEGRIGRLISQKHKLGERIFEHYDHGDGWGKKKGMHWKTFNRLHARY